jgi:Kef-type K+ transport system membrane component KefB
MLALAAALFLVIRAVGETLPAGTVELAEPVRPNLTPSAGNVLLHVLLALAVVTAVGWLLGRACAWIGQPAVIGEVLAGIVLGPSLLGRVAPSAAEVLLPATVAPYLGVVAQLGIIIYMFLVGLELSGEQLHGRARATLVISNSSIAVPFLLGAALALWLFPRHAPSGVPFTSFALFMGVALAITAFPVLARILADRGMAHSELGVLALTCAAFGDVSAWCLLAFVVGVAQTSILGALGSVGLAAAYIGFMLVLARPVINRWLKSRLAAEPSRSLLVLTLAGLLVSALTTELIGIHALFGAFLFGAIIPHDSALARALKLKLHDGVTILFLPAFFALTGMRTEIGLVHGVESWVECGLIILVATLGKFGGTFAAAWLTGLDWRDSAALGVLMNTRGLMELIVLNIGLELGIIAPPLFAMLVLMALVTTLATTPLLNLLVPAARPQR